MTYITKYSENIKRSLLYKLRKICSHVALVEIKKNGGLNVSFVLYKSLKLQFGKTFICLFRFGQVFFNNLVLYKHG